MAVLVLVVYGLSLLFIFLYSMIQIQLVYHYLRKKIQFRKNGNFQSTNSESEYPSVSIQLPVYNEKYVVQRLIEHVVQIRYPKDKLDIQVLDDSTDETVEIVSGLVAGYREEGFDIVQICRKNRQGFKAGALAEGLNTAKGEFIAIFDADFLPKPDFLERTIKSFSDDEIGMVQTRWEHVNKDYSLLTRLQAFGLDAHFSVEQSGRNFGGHFINFNGTAGVWRKSCITDAGGWQSDTLTEDLDLSYRAQLKGWRFVFIEDCGSPAELPAEMNALKTQQYRWTKGAAECSRKNLFQLMKSRNFSFNTKVNGIFHLLNSTLFICIVITSVLSIPVIFIKHHYPEYDILYKMAGTFLLGMLFLTVFYFVSFSTASKNLFRTISSFVVQFPLFLSVSMGLSLHNGIAAFEGLIGKKSAFMRTPKFNIQKRTDGWKSNHYTSGRIGKLTYIELLLVLYFLTGLGLSYYFNDYGLFPFLILLVFGYSYVAILSIKHALSS